MTIPEAYSPPSLGYHRRGLPPSPRRSLSRAAAGYQRLLPEHARFPPSWSRATLAAAAFVAVAALSFPAAAQEQPQDCGPGDQYLGQLMERFGESPTGAGITDGGTVVLTTNPETRSWSLLVSRPDGTLCMIAAGEGWSPLVPLAPTKGDPA